MQKRNSEKRQYPRIDHKLPIKVIANGYDFETTTKNISCVGTYCHVNKYVPPFTKIFIKLDLPVATNKTLECKGVVVRTDDEKDGGFNLAIFFNDIKEPQKQKITQYISQSIS